MLGDVNGKLQDAFKKLAVQHTKNNFTFAIVTGDLFSEDDETVGDLLANKIEIPLPTYFTIGTSPLPERVIEKLQTGEDLCDNLHFLGKCSTTKTLEGLRIVALGGLPDTTFPPGLSADKYTPFHTTGDAKSLYGAHSADILITAAWPAAIRKGSNKPIPEGVTPPEGYDHISDLCTTLKPRYHLSATPEFFFEREPFVHASSTDAPDFRPLTRFLSLAAYGNTIKAKALYAFQLATKVDEQAVLPAGTTIAPFSLSKIGDKKRRAPLEPEPYSRYGGDGQGGHRDNKRGKGRRGERRPPPGPNECFFCTGNENFDTDLVTAVGDDSYLTVAKGPLTTSETFKEFGIDFPAHGLIIPLAHSPTLGLVPEAERVSTFNEMNKFKKALQEMVAKKSNNQLGSITYEISLYRGVHTHWQFLPVNVDLINKKLVEAAFRVEADNSNFPPFEVRDPEIGEKEGDFFRVWIWTPPTEEAPEGSTKCLTMPIDDNVRFNLQFGRTTLAKLLGLEKRIQWRDCGQTKEEELKDSAALKAAFDSYDFTKESE